MKRKVKVKVEWTKEKLLKALPTSGSYITMARFIENNLSAKESWSVVLEFPPANGVKETFEATACFLMDEAPHEYLRGGCVFEMYEGLKKTARITVLEGHT
jgi:hypothetical protein